MTGLMRSHTEQDAFDEAALPLSQRAAAGARVDSPWLDGLNPLRRFALAARG